MAVTALDENFNYVEAPETVFISGNDEAAQNIINCLCLLPGEDCVNPDVGIDWRRDPYRNADGNNVRVQRRLRQKIEADNGVRRVRDISYSGISGVDGRYCIEVELNIGSVLTIEDKLNG